MDLETEAKPRFLNHEDLRVGLLTYLEYGSLANLYQCHDIYIKAWIDYGFLIHSYLGSWLPIHPTTALIVFIWNLVRIDCGFQFIYIASYR